MRVCFPRVKVLLSWTVQLTELDECVQHQRRSTSCALLKRRGLDSDHGDGFIGAMGNCVFLGQGGDRLSRPPFCDRQAQPRGPALDAGTYPRELSVSGDQLYVRDHPTNRRERLECLRESVASWPNQIDQSIRPQSGRKLHRLHNDQTDRLWHSTDQCPRRCSEGQERTEDRFHNRYQIESSDALLAHGDEPNPQHATTRHIRVCGCGSLVLVSRPSDFIGADTAFRIGVRPAEGRC